MKIFSMCFILFLTIITPVLATSETTSPVTSYQMDLFSIMSLALAIAALLLSGFMAWLSWELFKKSSDTSEKTQQAVVRVEATVQGVQDDITEIVRRAVGYWIDGSGSDHSSEEPDNTDEKFEDLQNQISELAKNNPAASDLEEKINTVLSEQRAQLKRLNTSLFDAKVRSIFPSAEKPPAAKLTQNISNNQEDLKDGWLTIEVTRPVKNATATGFFRPAFASVPELEVELESSPYEDDSEVKLASGVGIKNNFNVHIIALNDTLKAGEYVVRYKATTNA